MKNNNAAQYSVTLGPFVIPVSGDNVFARITKADRASVTRGLASSVVNRMVNPDHVLTITAYKQDASFPILRQLEKQVEAAAIAGERLPLPGSSQDPLDPHVWADAELITAGDQVLAQETEAVSFTFALDSAVPG